MRKEYTKLVERKIVDIICDICGETAKGRQCCICGRDVCNIHAHFENDRYGGDYSEKYCIECWEISKSFRDKKEELEKKYESDIANVEKEWKNEVLNKKRKTKENDETDNVT